MFKWFKKKKKPVKVTEVTESINLDSTSSKAVPFDELEMGKIYFMIKITQDRIPMEFYQVFIDEVRNYYSYFSCVGGMQLKKPSTTRKVYFLRLDKCPYSNIEELCSKNYVFRHRDTWSIDEAASTDYFFYDSFKTLKEGSALLLKKVEQKRTEELQKNITTQMKLGKDQIKKELKALEFELDSLQN